MVTLSLTEMVARNVAHAIVMAGENPHSIARRTGIPRVTLIRRLQGISPFTVKELEQISSALDAPVDLFFAGQVAA